LAFQRGEGVLTVVPRLPLALGAAWEDTAVDLPAGRWRNVLTGEDVADRAPMSQLLARFPVALLLRQPLG
jgi:(1->4)-alpha-D-glucan 1-alpha-D-glucosylmutase